MIHCFGAICLTKTKKTNSQHSAGLGLGVDEKCSTAHHRRGVEEARPPLERMNPWKGREGISLALDETSCNAIGIRWPFVCYSAMFLLIPVYTVYSVSSIDYHPKSNLVHLAQSSLGFPAS